MKVIVMPWHPWPVERSWPASAAEESEFVAALVEHAAIDRTPATGGCSRADVTAVVTALRNGAGADDVLAWASGLSAARLLAAYQDLDRRRRQAVDAWQALVADPTTTALATCGPAAARVVPAAVGQMTRVLRETSAAGLQLAAAKLQTRMDEAGRAVDATERELAGERDPDRATALGKRLFTPHAECLWAEPMFLPSRVGQLSPLRVANLVADDVEVDGVEVDQVA